MSKYKAIVQVNSCESDNRELGKFKTRDEAVKALLSYGHENVSYCLDSYAERENALKHRDFCLCGCGPTSLVIEEV